MLKLIFGLFGGYWRGSEANSKNISLFKSHTYIHRYSSSICMWLPLITMRTRWALTSCKWNQTPLNVRNVRKISGVTGVGYPTHVYNCGVFNILWPLTYNWSWDPPCSKLRSQHDGKPRLDTGTSVFPFSVWAEDAFQIFWKVIFPETSPNCGFNTRFVDDSMGFRDGIPSEKLALPYLDVPGS